MFDFLSDAMVVCSKRIQELGGTVIRQERTAPADSNQIEEVARRFGGTIPPELLELGRFANKLDFAWKLEGAGHTAFDRLKIPLGELEWNFAALRPLDPHDYAWAEDIVAGRSKGVWHEKAIIASARNGDFLAYTIDPKVPLTPVYCAKSGCEPTELVLGKSLESFFRAWAQIGFLSITNMYQWPKKTGMDMFDPSYFSQFRRALGMTSVV